jgi:hypothetical protein
VHRAVIARGIIAAMCWCMLASAAMTRATEPRHARAPASQPATEDPERKKWESRILFFGDESSGEWSLRIRDQDVDQVHQFRMPELWTYERQTKRWTMLGTTPYKTTMVLPDQKPDAQKGEPNQILIVLPIEQDQVGLYYAKWAVDEVKGSTFFRIGPGLDKKSDRLKEKPPSGKIAAIIPLDLKHAEAAMITDPRVACEP